MNGTPAASRPRTTRALTLLLLWLLPLAGLHPLLLPDEGRYAGVAQAMLQSGDWLVPRLHGLPYFHKPPLMYWVDAAAMHAFGINEWTARAAPLLGAWIMGASTWLALRARVKPSRTLWSLVVLSTTPAFFVGAQYANQDMLVAGWITLTVACALRAVDALPPPAFGASLQQSRRWTVAAWMAAALAVLSKGLIGVVLPVLILLPWLAWQRHWAALWRLLDPVGLLAFAALVLPWFLAIEARFPGALDYFVVEQHLRRYTQSSFNNPQPFWFFLAALPLSTLPWSLALPAVMQRWRLVLREPGLALLVWWVSVVIVFFSLPVSKLAGYMFPALAPWATLLALSIPEGRWRWVGAASTPLVCGAALLVLSARPTVSHRDIGLVLRDQLQDGDRVVLVNRPFFDLSFYARLRQAPMVLSDWDDPRIAREDNWRKELHDAARFDAAAATRVLQPQSRAQALRCGTARTFWVSVDVPPWLTDATVVLRGRHAWLLRTETAPSAHCQ